MGTKAVAAAMPRKRVEPTARTRALPKSRNENEAGTPMRMGAALAAWPQVPSKRNSSIPRLMPVRCSNAESPPTIAVKYPNKQAAKLLLYSLCSPFSNRRAMPAEMLQTAALGNMEMPCAAQSVKRG